MSVVVVVIVVVSVCSPLMHLVMLVFFLSIKRGRRTVVRADGAALVMGDDGVGAVSCVLADDLIAHHRAAVAHTDLTWLWFPHIPVRKHLAVQGAASARA